MFFSLCCQAHDIIVVELAPPPPRETNEETDPALDADAAAAVIVPKVPEKKKVYQECVLVFRTSLTTLFIESGARVPQHPSHQKRARARLHGPLLAGGHTCRPQVPHTIFFLHLDLLVSHVVY